MKHIAIIGIVGLPANYGGFESFVEQLVQRLWENWELTVFCQKSAYETHPDHFGKVHLRYLPLKANGVWSILYDMLAILKSLRFADTLLILGVGGCVLLPLLRWLGCRKRIVVNIDGIEWRRDKWSGFARWFLHFSEKCAVKYADAVIGDNQVIADYVQEAYHRPCQLIEYGADHAVSSGKPVDASDLPVSVPQSSFAFGVCRIEPENHVHLLLEAFASDEAGMPLIMVGNWNRSEYGRQLRETFGKHHNLTLLDPIYDLDKLNVYRAQCSLYLHGHSCGGTNPSLVEAMYLGRAIAAYDCNFNRETTENRALYFQTSEDLRKIAVGTREKSEELKELGAAMREIAERRYTWERIARCYAALF